MSALDASSITVTALPPSPKIGPNIYCEFCGRNEWFQRTPRSSKVRVSVMAPCRWEINNKEFHGHAAEILLGQIFRNTIDARVISQNFCKIPDSQAKKISFAKKIIVNLRIGQLGKILGIEERLDKLQASTLGDSFQGREYYKAIEASAGQDMYQAFSWLKDSSSSDHEDVKEDSGNNLDSSSSSNSNTSHKEMPSTDHFDYV